MPGNELGGLPAEALSCRRNDIALRAAGIGEDRRGLPRRADRRAEIHQRLGEVARCVKLLRELIKENINLPALAKSVPFVVSTTDLTTWEPRAYGISILAYRGAYPQVVDALTASAAAPIGFPPVGDQVDGGVINNFQVADAVHAGAERIIALVPTRPERRPIRNVLDMLSVMLAIPEYGYLTREMRFVEKLNTIPGYKNIEVILVQPAEPTGIDLLDFDLKGRNRKQLIADSREQALRLLKKVVVNA